MAPLLEVLQKVELFEKWHIAKDHTLNAVLDEVFLAYKFGQLVFTRRNLKEASLRKDYVAGLNNFRVLGLFENHGLAVIK